MRIEGWLRLSPKQREKCILKLRYELLSPSFAQACLAKDTSGLVRERDEKAQSIAVNADELEARLM